MKNNNTLTTIIAIIIAILLAILAAASVTIAIALLTPNETTVASDAAEPVNTEAPANEVKAPAKVRVAVIKGWDDTIESSTNKWLAEHSNCEIVDIQHSLPQRSSSGYQSVYVTITYIEK